MKSVAAEIFPRLGLKAHQPGAFAGEWFGSGAPLAKSSPIDGTPLGEVTTPTGVELARAIGATERAYHVWRDVPAPRLPLQPVPIERPEEQPECLGCTASG